MKIVRIIAFSLAVVAAIWMLVLKQNGTSSSDEPLPINTRLGGDFTLPSTQPNGMTEDSTASLFDFKGKIVLLNFGFTYCPDVCPVVLARMAQTLQMLEQKGVDVGSIQPVFVSFDPARDTVERLAEFLPYFHPSFVGFTGTEEQIKKVGQQYGVVYIRRDLESELGYAFSHTDFIYLLDGQGRVRSLYGSDDTPASISAGVTNLLFENR